MNLYLLKARDFNNQYDYDVYYEAVVAAPTNALALRIHPSGKQEDWNDPNANGWPEGGRLSCTLIGTAHKRIKQGVVSSSFNAG